MIAPFDHSMRQFAELDPAVKLSWEDSKFVLQRPGFWDFIGKIVSNLTCSSQSGEDPFCLSVSTVQKIDAFIDASSPLMTAKYHEPLRRLKLYLAVFSSQNGQIAPVINKISQLLKTRVCAPFFLLPQDLLKKIASYDTSGYSYTTLRLVTSSAHARLPLDHFVRVGFCTNGHRQNICRLVETIIATSTTDKQMAVDLTDRFLQQASPKAQKLFWKYVGYTKSKVVWDIIYHKVVNLTLGDFLKQIAPRIFFLKFPNLVSLRCSSELNVLRLVKNCPKLQYLYLKGGEDYSESLSRYSFPAELRALRTKHLPLDASVVNQLQALRNLEEFSSTFAIGSDALEGIGKIATLKKLTVSISSEMADRLLGIVERLPQLQELSVFGTEPSIQVWNGLVRPARPILGIEAGIKFLQRCPYLVSLEMGQLNGFTIEQAEQLKAALKASKIKRLYLQVYGEGVATLWPTLLQLPHLVVLKFWTSCKNLVDVPLDQRISIEKLHFENEEKSSAVKMIAKLHKLSYLTLRCPLDESDIAALTACSTLCTFRYKDEFRFTQGHHMLSDRDLQKLATNRSIEEIYLADGNVSRGNEITPQGMLQLLRQNPQLHTLATLSPYFIDCLEAEQITPREAFALAKGKEY